ncbi:MAG: hypothetical protein M1820_005841 [Bogoriella megaspora]|nr:MAG: hypothetical protein M1820_005841 [Bogoriella megaspora]
MARPPSAKASDSPQIISMEVDDEDTWQSEYRIQIGQRIKYLVVEPGTFDRDTLSFPLSSLPQLPYDEDWTMAHISRDRTNGILKKLLSNKSLARVKGVWHSNMVEYLNLARVKQLTGATFEARYCSTSPKDIASPATVVVALLPGGP